MQLQIESTNLCNARCVFCLHPKMKRKQGTMSMELFRKIIDESVEIPLIDYMTITGLGEPLLDKYLKERLAYVRKKKAIKIFSLFTNGSLLTKKNIPMLLKHLDRIYINLNAVNAYQRKAIMGLDDYDRVVEMCDYAIEYSKKTDCRVYVKAVYGKDLMESEDNVAFENRWHGPETEGGNAFLHLEGNWAGETWKARVAQKKGCFRALTQMMVLWDGRVSMCCFDGEGQIILGDLNTQTIKEVFNGPKALEMRMAHFEDRRWEIPLCKRCTAI